MTRAKTREKPDALATDLQVSAKMNRSTPVMAGYGAAVPGAVNKDEPPDARVRRLAKQHTEDAVEALARIMTDPATPASAVVSAATAILDRGWGKPRQDLDITQKSYDMTALHLAALQELVEERRALRQIDVTPISGTDRG